MSRPRFEDIKTGNEFNQWYWLKDEMITICKLLELPIKGRKFDLRDRIMYALDNDGKLKPEPKKRSIQSKFNWAKSQLSLETLITDNVSFGPNFRRFMKNQIGNKFSCHSDFMDWVKSNAGKSLSDAVDKWNELERRKEDPNFKRTIADNNMLAQYTRDFLEDNKNKTLKDAKKYWNLKKQLPTKNGFVRYESSDLKLE
ncbi:DUF6434 domain-containing protein [Winogradskyella sp.]|uniref:DUF6434 domain-containing protein n=1 Tax=Winogradskyella sp. TaxID=1883156 RepID=UPI003BA9BAC5